MSLHDSRSSEPLCVASDSMFYSLTLCTLQIVFMINCFMIIKSVQGSVLHWSKKKLIKIIKNVIYVFAQKTDVEGFSPNLFVLQSRQHNHYL